MTPGFSKFLSDNGYQSDMNITKYNNILYQENVVGYLILYIKELYKYIDHKNKLKVEDEFIKVIYSLNDPYHDLNKLIIKIEGLK